LHSLRFDPGAQAGNFANVFLFLFVHPQVEQFLLPGLTQFIDGFRQPSFHVCFVDRELLLDVNNGAAIASQVEATGFSDRRAEKKLLELVQTQVCVQFGRWIGRADRHGRKVDRLELRLQADRFEALALSEPVRESFMNFSPAVRAAATA